MIAITNREAQIWAMYVQGQTRKEIANELNRSFHTVNQITRNLYDKLHITKETDLVREWFLYHAFITRDELSRAIRQKAAPVVIAMLMLTAAQIVFDSPAVRVVRNPITRCVTRTASGRRKTYEL